MKRIKVLTVALLCGLFLTACSGSNSDKNEESKSVKKEAVKDVKATKFYDKDGNRVTILLPDTGDATLVLHNDTCSTENGKTPTVYYESNTTPTEIGLETKGLDRALFTYIYCDGKIITQEHYGDVSTTVELPVEKDAVMEGPHTITVAQYEGNDESEDSKVINAKSQNFTVKIE